MSPNAFRILVLRVLFWSLGLGAVAGVLAVLTARQWIVARALGTLLSTAGAALLLLPISFLIDRVRTRASGLLGTAVVVFEYLLLLGLIWEVFDAIGGSWTWQLPDRVGESMGWLAAVTVASMIMLWARHFPATRPASSVGLWLAGLFFAVILIPTWMPGSRWSHEEWWATAAAIGCFGPVTIACLVGVGTDRRHWRYAGVAAAATAAIGMILAGWDVVGNLEEPWSIPVAISLLVAYVNICVRVPLRGAQVWLLYVTLAAAAGTALFVELLIFDIDPEIIERLTAACAIVTGCGTLALVVLARINRPVEVGRLADATADVKVTLLCPRCRRKLRVEAGTPTACGTCRLRIEVRVEEPACAQCGYLLIGSESDRCPECGAGIAAHSPCQVPA